MNRSLLLFQNSLKSDVSVSNYTRHLDLFMAFAGKEMNLKLDYDSLSTIPISQLQILVEDYVMTLKKKLNPNSIPAYYYPLQSFFESNDVDLKWRKIRKLFPQKVKVSGDKPYTNDDIKNMLDVTPQLRNKAIIHFLASSGCRLGALPKLQLRHLFKMSDCCKSVLVYEDSIEEYYTFLTPESSKSLDAYIEQRKNDGEIFSESSPVFRNKYLLGTEPVKEMGEKSIQNVVARAVLKSGIRGTKKRNGRYEKQTDHAFRKRFNTILKLNNDVNSNVVEKMLGHKNGLDSVYLKPTQEQMFEEFRKAIPELTIDESERLKVKNQDLENDTERQNMKKELDYIKENMENVISEKIKQQSTKLLEDLEKIMKNSSKKVQMKMERGDLKLFKGMSKNGAEFEKMKSSYHNKN